MLINTSEVLKSLEGEPYKVGEKDLTVGRAIAEVLSSVKSLNPLLSYTLALKFFGSEEVDIKAEDIAFIKTLIPQSGYYPIIQGKLLSVLDL